MAGGNVQKYVPFLDLVDLVFGRCIGRGFAIVITYVGGSIVSFNCTLRKIGSSTLTLVLYKQVDFTIRFRELTMIIY